MMEKAGNNIAEHFMNVSRIHKDKKAAGGQRGHTEFRRQIQLRKKKEKHAV